MNPRRALAVARAHIRELSRRKLAVTLLIGLPLLFYFAAFNPRVAISFAMVGFGWSVAIIALFSTHSMIAITPRLALVGYRPAEMVIGRVLAIATYAFVLGLALLLFLRTDSVVIDEAQLIPGLALGFLGASTAGLAVGSILDREMEAMLVLIALVALTLVVDWDSFLARALPMYATNRYSWASVDGFFAEDKSPWKATVVVSSVLAAIAVVGTWIRVPRITNRGAIPGGPND